ncbi:DUF4199 domain-containing protein [Zunongwangia endophytica]|uniref:DUF4199 domain-containing protein n=1 Tax=Zunongwangia endophytica TaxID=1808945 RepID=A0ABV8H9K2_9FLAO|nr:DUF4199 domain-containing protein [Zunongwangia endophytica]MDN3593852.1 DUF4199 domain-containing protein [Zunongwangia endophytica]
MENSTSVKSVAYPFGIALALYSIIYLVLVYVFNVSQEDWVVGLISKFIEIAIFVFALITFKKKNENVISLKQSLKVGLGAAVIGGIIAAIYTYIHYKFIYPEFLQSMYDTQVLAMSEQNLTAEQMEGALTWVEYTSSPWVYSAMQIIGYLILGFIISLLTGLIIRNNQAQDY